jgi:Beta-galactosidase
LSTGHIFRSFLQAGFECSTHKRRDGTRLDLLRQSEHDRFTMEDFRRIKQFEINTIRTAARWHLIEQTPGRYDFSSLERSIQAAYATETQLLLDLLHFGWPDYLDIFAPEFVRAFGNYVRALARYMRSHRGVCTVFAPVNEISFFSWAGGDVAAINPYQRGRSRELKRILVRAAVTASEILLNELANIRLIWPEPVIHIIGNPRIPGDDVQAELYRLSQFEAWDMLSGRLAPELGGRPEYVDIIGTNFYERNEWVHSSDSIHPEPLRRHDPRYRPFHKIVQEVWERYRRPMFVSETGTEDDRRADWFNYICDEIEIAQQIGVQVHGICLYPILNHPGWEDNRHCCNGLFDYADASGHREIYQPLANAINQRREKLRYNTRAWNQFEEHRSDLSIASTVGFRVSAASTSNEPLCT